MRRIVAKLRTAADIAEDRPIPQSDEEIVIQFVEGLPQPEREIFLRHRQGETFRQIAAEMGIAPETALMSLSKVYSSLRVTLEPSG